MRPAQADPGAWASRRSLSMAETPSELSVNPTSRVGGREWGKQVVEAVKTWHLQAPTLPAPCGGLCSHRSFWLVAVPTPPPQTHSNPPFKG